MSKHWRGILGCGGAAVSALLLLFLLLATPALAQQAQPLAPLGMVESRITNSAGEQWVLDLCAGDRVTVTIASAAFTPFVSIYTDTLTAPVSEVTSEDGVQAQTVLLATEESRYLITAAGERRSDRGAYTIQADFGAPVPAELAFAGVLASQATVTGSVRSSAGESWVWRGCAGDVVTVTASSAAFTPYLELFDPATAETVAESNAASSGDAAIDGAEVPATGLYMLIIAGERRNDRGAYTLTLNPDARTLAAPLASTPTRPASAAATPVPTRRAAATAAPAALCTVRANPSLNVRSGPGTVFAPPIGTANFNAQLRPLARNLDATWIEVQVLPGGLRGWVATGAQFIACTIDPTTLPVGIIPPTPTPSPSPTPAPTFTLVPTLPPVVVAPPSPTAAPIATLPPVVVLPGGGPGGGGWRGAIVTGFDLVSVNDGNATFRDRIYFRAEIDRTPDNRAIERVDFRIQDDFGDEFYRRTERSYGYCAFGGGEPNCNVLAINRGARWPDTDRPLCNGQYQVFADIVLDNGDSSTWNTPFAIDNPDLPRCGDTTQQSDLVAYIAQSGPGDASGAAYGALVFQVVAFDPGRGSQDGDGIRAVDLRIFDPDGVEVYQRTENRAAYCAFAGGEPECNVWYFGDNGDAWPSGEPVRYDEPYRLFGRVNAEDGRTLEVEMMVFIEP